MSYDNRITIKKAANGYTVSLKDPKIVKRNNARNTKESGAVPYCDPNVEFVFKSVKEVQDFLGKTLEDALTSGEDYDSTFARAAQESSNDD